MFRSPQSSDFKEFCFDQKRYQFREVVLCYYSLRWFKKHSSGKFQKIKYYILVDINNTIYILSRLLYKKSYLTRAITGVYIIICVSQTKSICQSIDARRSRFSWIITGFKIPLKSIHISQFEILYLSSKDIHHSHASHETSGRTYLVGILKHYEIATFLIMP